MSGARGDAPRRNGKSYRSLYRLHPPQSARAAKLRYLADDAPGIMRKRAGGGFRYIGPQGRVVRDAETLSRIRALAIPPAWREVWISPLADAHLQATGRDARSRKQYRYHPRWREVRDENKYHRMLAFGKALRRIRRRVQRDLALPGLRREKVLATVVRLLERTFIRVGNEEYARQNESFGLTTLREHQVRVEGDTLKFRFRGKSGVQHDVRLSDRRLAAIVARMQDLPGYELFQYVDEEGAVRTLESSDVNAYLKSVAGEDFTSKDFRTWAGTVLAARELAKLAPAGSVSEAKRCIVEAIDSVARELRNTRSVCKKCYIHPAVLESYVDGSLHRAMRQRSEESAVILLLQRQRRRSLDHAKRSGAAGASLAPVLARSLAARNRKGARFGTAIAGQ